jgi:hypothetical protein
MEAMSRSRCAEHFRRATREADAARTVEARLERALALGRIGIELYASANGLSPEEARESVRRRREAQRQRAHGARDL